MVRIMFVFAAIIVLLSGCSNDYNLERAYIISHSETDAGDSNNIDE